MKIFFRYLFLELLKPFIFCVIACSVLWIVADLFGSLDEFFEKNASWSLISQYYLAQIPKMLVPVLPVSMLFASLFALLSLNRHNELTALFCGGLSPLRVFTPFITLGILVTVFLFYILSGPATQSEAKRNRILKQIRNDIRDPNAIKALVYVDREKRRTWFISTLNTVTNDAEDMELLERNTFGSDIRKYFATKGHYNGKYWDLKKVKKITFSTNGKVLEQALYEQVSLPSYTTSPRELALTQAMPEELKLSQLYEIIHQPGNETSTHMAPYYTQFNYLIAYPFTIIVLLAFAFSLGTQATRRSPAAGVFNAIFVLLGFLFVMNFFLAMGRGHRIPAVIAAWAAHFIFGGIALYMMAQKFGWFWHLDRWALARFPFPMTRLKSLRRARRESPHLPASMMQLRLKSLQLLLNKITKQSAEVDHSASSSTKNQS